MKSKLPYVVRSIDVARLAGVSRSAVSRTYTEGAYVADDTRQKVLKAAAQLGYSPNAIARGLITQPSVLLMDEPFAALDEITRFRLNDDLLAMWAGQQWTVIFVTHSVYESVYLSDRIVVMGARPGRVTADIRIDEPYPRSEAFRLSGRYNDYCRLVSAALHETMA